MNRRNLLALPALIAAPAAAQAPWVPDRPIRIIAPFAPGGASDQISRILAEELTPLLGQQVIVENRTGAGGAVGTEFVARSRPDGLTLVTASQATHGVNPVVQRLNFDPFGDMTPIGNMAGVPAVFVVGPQAQPRTFAEFLAFVRARPGRENYASAGVGSSTHMTFALMAHMAGLDIQHVPFRGTGLAVPEVIAGRLLSLADTVNTSLPFIRDGRLRALAVSTRARLSVLPDVPTVGEFLPGYEVLNWYGLHGPAGLAPNIVSTIHTAMMTLLNRPTFLTRLESLGMVPLPMTTAEYATYAENDRRQWAELVRATGMRVD